MSQYGNYTNDLNTPTKMKKTLTIIATIILFPFVLSGIILSIPTRAFIEGYKLGNNMIDSGKI
jgi:hypothetical protein